jgi:hypothetical protein
VSVRCEIYRLTAAGPERADVVHPGDEVVLLVERDPDDAPAGLIVELRRGDRQRDCQVVAVRDRAAALRLWWGCGPASARLTCVVRHGGRELFRRTLLLGPAAADAQGRLPAGSAAAASPATLLAYAGVLTGWLTAGSDQRRRKS